MRQHVAPADGLSAPLASDNSTSGRLFYMAARARTMWSFRVDVGLREAVEAARKEAGLSRSSWLIRAVRNGLAKEATR